MKTTENTVAETPSPANRSRWHTVTKRDGKWLAGLAAFALAALVVWKPLQHELAMFLVLRSDGPSEAALSELAGDAGNPAGNLTRMWRSGNLTARVFVMNYLKTNLHKEPPLVGQMAAVIAEAARDPDVDVREPAFNLLAESKQPESLALLRQQLLDLDPAVRVLALQQLYEAADSNDVPVAISLLDDSDPRVVVQAALLLHRTTGCDFGIRTSQAIPRFAPLEGEPPPPPDMEPIQRGVQLWHEWWTRHHGEFPEPVKLLRADPFALPIKDFALEDSNGRRVRLSDFRGKTVLLCFWKTGDSVIFDDLATLKALQAQASQRLAVVGVAFDSTVGPQDCDGDEDMPMHMDHAPMTMSGDHSHMIMNASPALAAMKSAVGDYISRMQIPFPVVVEQKGATVFRFNVQEIPTYILIDADGHLRRRFIGSRNLAAFKAMVAEAATPTTLSKLDR